MKNNNPDTKKESDKSKYYIKNKPDMISLAFYFLVISFFIFYVFKKVTNISNALPILFLIPAFISIVFFLVLLPFRVLNSVACAIIVYAYTWSCKKNTPAKTVVVIGKTDYKRPSYWFNPNFELDLILVLKYLKEKNEDYAIYNEINQATLDEIMENKHIRTVYLFGHGRRHGFVIDSNTIADYCRYDNPKYAKDYVYQIHCNQGGGKSLVEYVVAPENREACLPEHGYMSSQSITEMFIDKLTELNKLGKIKRTLINSGYYMLTTGIPAIILSFWIYLLSIIISK
ncbi:MAG: hypothetical protein V1859_02480 [archaeon]